MLHDIAHPIAAVMRRLELIDARDRTDGTPRMERLRQIPRETGEFLALMASSAPDGRWLEIGTSAGYSTLWLALAARERARTVTTYEVLAAKAALARETFRDAQVEDVVTLVEGDFLAEASNLEGIAFCFLAAEKEVYGACYDGVVPRLVSGGWLVADNAINHRETLQPMIDVARGDPRVDALVVPIGKGELVCRKL